jgi:ribonuclease HII
MKKSRPTFAREANARRRGNATIAGCDEVGCGAWAGPIVAAAVILDPLRIPKGLNDSKALSPELREKLFTEISASAEISIASAPPYRIDRDNVLNARLWALAQAVRGLARRVDITFVDGPHSPPIDGEVRTVVGGDSIVASIAAASIIAKVTRDRLMRVLSSVYPAYGFSKHKGYGTKSHASALERCVPCIHHRRTFLPVRFLKNFPPVSLAQVNPATTLLGAAKLSPAEHEWSSDHYANNATTVFTCASVR